MMKTSGLGLFLCALLASASLSAQPTGFLVDTSLSLTSASGPVRTADSGAPALDLGNLSLGASSFNFQPRLRYITDRYRIEVGFDRSGFLRSFGGSELASARSGLSTSVSLLSVHTDYRSFSAGFRYDFLRTPTLSLGAGAEADVYSVRSQVLSYGSAGTATGRTDTDSSQASPLASAGVNLHDRGNRLFLDLKVAYGPLNGSVLKGRVEAGYSFAKYAGIKLGWEGARYRGESIDRLNLELSRASGGFFFRF